MIAFFIVTNSIKTLKMVQSKRGEKNMKKNIYIYTHTASLVAQLVKNLPAMQETPV